MLGYADQWGQVWPIGTGERIEMDDVWIAGPYPESRVIPTRDRLGGEAGLFPLAGSQAALSRRDWTIHHRTTREAIHAHGFCLRRDIGE